MGSLSNPVAGLYLSASLDKFSRQRPVLLLILLLGLVGPGSVFGQQGFIRGDTNDDSLVNIADAVSVLEYLFGTSGALPCLNAADTNDDELVNIADGIYLLASLFSGGPPPPPPHPACGVDPTASSLGCTGPLLACPGVTPLEFVWPMPGVDGTEWVINNYVDLDSGSGVLDYLGGSKSYNGHNGVDIDVPTFRAMDNDFPILAAAAGTVVAFVDSNFDRNTSCSGQWNYVTIEHENGWRTTYGHLKQDSVVVTMGQAVVAGELLGVVGSSGCSTAPHLHFEVRDETNQVVSPFLAGMWLNPPVYDTPLSFMDATLYRQPITDIDMIKDPAPNISVVEPGGTLGVGLSMAGGASGDEIVLRILTPGGTVLSQGTIPISQVLRHSYWIWNFGIPPGTPQGWHDLEIRLNGTLTATYPIFVGPVYTGFHQVRHGLPLAQYQGVFDALVANGYRPVWFDGYVHNGANFCNLIFHQNTTGLVWSAAHNMTAAQYQTYFTQSTDQGFRLAHVESYLIGGTRNYAAIFEDTSGPLWLGFHETTQAGFDSLWNDYVVNQGYRVKNLSVINSGGNLYYTGIVDQEPVGGWVALVGMTSAQYQSEFNNNVAAGRSLAYLNHYMVGTSPRFVAVWDSVNPLTWVAIHDQTSAQFQGQFDTWIAAGLTTRIVTGYQSGTIQLFAGSWSD